MKQEIQISALGTNWTQESYRSTPAFGITADTAKTASTTATTPEVVTIEASVVTAEAFARDGKKVFTTPIAQDELKKH
jgi:hypothetical protein